MYQGLNFSEQTFNTVVAATIDQQRLSVRPESQINSVGLEERFAGLVSVDGLRNVIITKRSSREPLEQAYILESASNEPYLLNGLLVHENRWVNTAVQTGSVQTAVHRVGIFEVSSPEGVNLAYASVGRIPGEDILEVVRVGEDKGEEFSAGEWIDGVIERKIKTAGLLFPNIVTHDLAPKEHLQSWLTMTPTMLDKIVARATKLKKEYGDAIYLGEFKAPNSVGNFAFGLEFLNDFTGPYFIQARAIGDLAVGHAEYQMFQLQRKILSKIDDLNDQNLFRYMGVIPSNVSRLDARNRLRDVSYSVVGQLGKTFLALDEVQPPVGVSSSELAGRKRNWQLLIDNFPDRMKRDAVAA